MAKDELGPVPPGLTKGASAGEIPNATIWLNRVSVISQRLASTTETGSVNQAAAQTDSTATTVSDLKDDLNALMAKLRAAGIQDT